MDDVLLQSREKPRVPSALPGGRRDICLSSLPPRPKQSLLPRRGKARTSHLDRAGRWEDGGLGAYFKAATGRRSKVRHPEKGGALLPGNSRSHSRFSGEAADTGARRSQAGEKIQMSVSGFPLQNLASKETTGDHLRGKGVRDK